MIPAPKALTLHPAYRGLLDLLEARYLPSSVPAQRWGWSEQHLANLRRAGKGPAYTRLGRSIRYSAAEVLAWELAGQSYHVTADRLALAVASLAQFTPDQRALISAHLESVLYGKGSV